MSSVRMYPLDVAALTKGQVLNVAQLLEILGRNEVDRLWGLRLINLQDRINKQREKLGLPPLTMRTEKGTLVICDDEGAADYNRESGKRGIRKFTRASVRNLHVDVSKLDGEKAAAHGRTIMRQAMILGAIRGARHRPLALPEAPQRTTPKMIKAPEANGGGLANAEGDKQ